MAEREDQSSVSLPDELQQQFTELERRLWKSETTFALCSAVTGLILSYFAVFLSDRFWNTPAWLRVAITAAGFGSLLWAGLRWARIWIFQRRGLAALSQLVQRRYRRLGDRLLGIVELADETRRPAHFSTALYRAAIQQVTDEATQFDFCEAVNVRPTKTRALTLAGLASLLLLALLVVPTAGWNAFRRWLTPAATVERYTLVNLEGLPAEQIVPHGEPFELSCTVKYNSLWRPKRARAQYDRQPSVAGVVQDRQIHFKIPGQVQAGRLKVRVGDAEGFVSVLPTHRPSLKDLSAAVALPAYLRYPALTENIKSGSLTLLEGSRVVFQGQATRSLKSAQVRVEASSPQKLEVRSNTFSSAALSLEGVAHCAFSWEDELGLRNLTPWPLTVLSTRDLPPSPALPDLAREFAVLETEVVRLKTIALDDFGVRELGLSWEMMSGADPSTNAAALPFKAEGASPQEKKLENDFYFNPALLKIPPDSVVELRAYAKDYFPDRERSETPVYRIHVLGNEKHAELVRQQLESLFVRLEEVTRLQEKIATNVSDLKALSQEKLSDEKTSDAITEAKEEQARNAAQLEQLAREGSKTLREAMRNPTLPEQTLRDWAKNIQQMESLAQGKMQEAAGALKSAQQSPESRAENLAEASKKAEETLQALQQMQRMANQGLDELQALTLAQRLRKLASQEKDIETQLRKNVPETIGLLTQDLPAKYQKANASLSGDQNQTQEESRILEREISRFYERTQQENYGEVSREMTEAKTGEELDKVRGLIAENISMQAIQNLAGWSERFNAWADKLEPKSESGGGGGGGGGSGNELANFLMKQLIALLRMREGEFNLRERTRLVEQQKAEASVYPEAVRSLSSAQRKLLKEVVQMQMDNIFPPLQEPLGEIYSTMEDAGLLLSQPRTDQVAVNAETKAIETLSDVINLINEQMQRNSSSQSAASQEMAFLMEMMSLQSSQSPGMQVGQNPGGNTAGGNTDQAATPAEGDAQGNEAGPRTVEKASGRSRNLPVEFREALENYFNAIEEKTK